MGTQYGRGTTAIGSALEIPRAQRALLPPEYPDIQANEGIQEAIWVESGLTREPRQALTQQGILEFQAGQPPALPETLGMDSRGDERQEGPIYTYARVFTWWTFTKRILDAFEASLNKMERGLTCSDMPNMSRTQHHNQQFRQSQLQQVAPSTEIPDANSPGKENDGLVDQVGRPLSDAPSTLLSPSPSPGPSATKQSAEYELEDMDPSDSQNPDWKGKGKATAVASSSNTAPPDTTNTQPRRRKVGEESAPEPFLRLGSSPASGSSTAVQNSTRADPPQNPPAASAWQTSRFCDLPDDREPAPTSNPPPTTRPIQPAPVRAYSSFAELSAGGAYKRMRKAVLVALFAQWGTTGAAIIIAWFTPMRGFGCRSGSYLVYGLVATGSLFFLVLSMVLSHRAMRLFQRRRRVDAQPFRLSWGHWGVCALANATRFVGKFLAVANAVILLLIAVFEFCGFFDNCWCKSCYPQYKEGGFAVLFRSDSDYQTIAKGAWIGGILLATFVSVILCCVFYWGRKKLR